MSLWKVVKDITESEKLTSISPQAVDAIITNMDTGDWEGMKLALREKIKDNKEMQHSLELILRIVDLIILKGPGALL